MDIIIAGAGEVGRHLATVLAEDNHQITLIDRQPAKLDLIGESLDARILVGSATRAETLLEAGADKADLFVSATDADEINLLAASVAKGLGSAKVIARVHHSAYHDAKGIDYAKHLHIDHLVCPEYLTSLAIARVLRDPAVQAIEHFARGRIVMERLEIGDKAVVTGKSLKALALPAGVRIGTVTQQGKTVVPSSETVLNVGDKITLIGTTDIFEKVRPMFHREQQRRRKIVIMGGSATSVWLTRALHPRSFSVRLYVTDHERAVELSEKLPHATVYEENPADPEVFVEENIADADAFVVSTDEDETNILGALQAKHFGVKMALVVINRPTYHQIIEDLGIDRAFSPRTIASREIQRLVQRKAVQLIAQLDEYGTGVYQIDIADEASAIGQTLQQLDLPRGCVLVAIQRGDNVRVPGPRDLLEASDTVIAIAHEGLIRKLNSLFG